VSEKDRQAAGVFSIGAPSDRRITSRPRTAAPRPLARHARTNRSRNRNQFPVEGHSSGHSPSPLTMPDTYLRSKQVSRQCVSYMKQLGNLDYNFDLKNIKQPESESRSVQPALAQEGTDSMEEINVTVPSSSQRMGGVCVWGWGQQVCHSWGGSWRLRGSYARRGRTPVARRFRFVHLRFA